MSLVVSAVEWSSPCNSLRLVRCGVVGWGEWGEGTHVILPERMPSLCTSLAVVKMCV